MATVAYREQVWRASEDLPEPQIEEVLDFIRSLKEPKPEKPPRGSAEALLPHAGTWEFEPGELAELLTEIEQLREIPE